MAGVSTSKGRSDWDRNRSGNAVTFDLRMEPPLREFQFRIFEFTRNITDWTVPLTACGQLFQRQMREVFASEGQASGEQWEELSEPYGTWKEENYPGMPIGVLTGALMESMTGGEGYSEHIDKTRADFGMDPSSEASDYGEYFAEERPVIRMTPEWGRAYQKVIQTWLVAEERGALGVGGSGIPEMVRRGGVVNIDWSLP